MVKTTANGKTTWTVQMGTSTAHTDVLAFAPTPAGVKAGDTVTFVNNSSAPHTASFNVPPTSRARTIPANVPTPAKSPETLTSTGFTRPGPCHRTPIRRGHPLEAPQLLVRGARCRHVQLRVHLPRAERMAGVITATA